METKHVLGVCDRCGKEIIAQKGQSVFSIKATNIKFETETYHLYMIFCPECKKSFESWLNSKVRAWNTS